MWRHLAETTLPLAREYRAGMLWNGDGCWYVATKPYDEVITTWGDQHEQWAGRLAWSAHVADGLLHVMEDVRRAPTPLTNIRWTEKAGIGLTWEMW